jgi:hypothetical protein
VSDVHQYIAAGLLDTIADERAWELHRIADFFERRHNLSVKIEDVSAAIKILSDCGLAFSAEDPFAGTFVKIARPRYKAFLDAVDQERDPNFKGRKREPMNAAFSAAVNAGFGPAIYRPNLDKYNKYKILKRYHVFGSEWIKRALSELSNHSSEDDAHQENDLLPNAIPASDRIVTLSDNQRTKLEASTSDLIDQLAKNNAVDGDDALQTRFLAQLSAAKELLRAQSVRAYLFYQLVVEVLSRLIKTYGTTALGKAATKLLELYIEYLVKG